jgi:hypothetical protein
MLSCLPFDVFRHNKSDYVASRIYTINKPTHSLVFLSFTYKILFEVF